MAKILGAEAPSDRVTYSYKFKNLLGVEVDVSKSTRSVGVRIILLGGSVTINLAASATGV